MTARETGGGGERDNRVPASPTTDGGNTPMTAKCLYGKAPEKDCGARACPIHGTPSGSPYGKRQGARKDNR